MSLWLCYAWAVIRFHLLQGKSKYMLKHKTKKKFWSLCLSLCLCLRQDRGFHGKIEMNK